MFRAFEKRWHSLGLAAALSLVAGEARAQPVRADVLKAAEALHDEALDALERGDHEVACAKLEEVVALVPQGLGARLTLAECYEAAGWLARAWEAYAELVPAAKKLGQEERRRIAQERAAALLPRVAKLRLEVPEDIARLEGLSIALDGEALPRGAWTEPRPVDRGTHRLEVKAGDGRTWDTSVEVARDGEEVAVEVEGPRESWVPAWPWGAQRTAGAAAVGAGVIALGVSAGLGLRAIALKDESEEGGRCVGNVCDPQGYALRQDGRAVGNASTAFFVVGLLSAGVGVTLWMTAPKDEKGAGAEVGLGMGSIAVKGRW